MRRRVSQCAAVLLLAAFGGSPAFGQLGPDEFEPNNSIGTATPIDCPYISPILNIASDDADIDYFEFTVDGDEEALVTAMVDCQLPGLVPVDSIVAILDEDGEIIGINDDSGSLCSSLTLVLEPGTYYVVVTSFPDINLDGVGDFFPKDSGEYVLTLDCVQPVPQVAYQFSGGGMARDADGNRAAIRFQASGIAPDIAPFGPGSIEDFSDIGGFGFNAYIYSSRTRINWVGPATRAAIIDFGDGTFVAVIDGPAMVNGEVQEVEIFVDSTGPEIFFGIFNITTFTELFSGFGLPGRSAASGTVGDGPTT